MANDYRTNYEVAKSEKDATHILNNPVEIVQNIKEDMDNGNIHGVKDAFHSVTSAFKDKEITVGLTPTERALNEIEPGSVKEREIVEQESVLGKVKGGVSKFAGDVKDKVVSLDKETSESSFTVDTWMPSLAELTPKDGDFANMKEPNRTAVYIVQASKIAAGSYVDGDDVVNDAVLQAYKDKMGDLKNQLESFGGDWTKALDLASGEFQRECNDSVGDSLSENDRINANMAHKLMLVYAGDDYEDKPLQGINYENTLQASGSATMQTISGFGDFLNKAKVFLTEKAETLKEMFDRGVAKAKTYVNEHFSDKENIAGDRLEKYGDPAENIVQNTENTYEYYN